MLSFDKSVYFFGIFNPQGEKIIISRLVSLLTTFLPPVVSIHKYSEFQSRRESSVGGRNIAQIPSRFLVLLAALYFNNNGTPLWKCSKLS